MLLEVKILILTAALLVGVTAGAWFGTSRRRKLEKGE